MEDFFDINDLEDIKSVFSIKLKVSNLESNPPISTILGNFGVNSIQFCKEYNEFTKELPNYLVLDVHIIIFTDKSYKFELKEPSVSFLIRLVSFNSKIDYVYKNKKKYEIVDVVKITDLYHILKFKFNNITDIN
jgi:large subunit ribosomal protein L11